jgi:Family of unknown function (DUF5999)
MTLIHVQSGTQQKVLFMCSHRPHCPSAFGSDRDAARVVASHPEQGWSLLCNGVVVFEDTGELLPDGRIVAPHRPTALSPAVVPVAAA